MQTRAPFEIPNASAAVFARTLFQSRSDTIKRQGDAWRGCRYKNIGSHSSLTSPTLCLTNKGNHRSRWKLFSPAIEGWIPRERGKLEKGRRNRKENGLQRREKFQSTIAFPTLTLLLLIWERGRVDYEEEWNEQASDSTRERNFRNIPPRFPIRLTGGEGGSYAPSAIEIFICRPYQPPNFLSPANRGDREVPKLPKIEEKERLIRVEFHDVYRVHFPHG